VDSSGQGGGEFGHSLRLRSAAIAMSSPLGGQLFSGNASPPKLMSLINVENDPLPHHQRFLLTVAGWIKPQKIHGKWPGRGPPCSPAGGELPPVPAEGYTAPWSDSRRFLDLPQVPLHSTQGPGSCQIADCFKFFIFPPFFSDDNRHTIFLQGPPKNIFVVGVFIAMPSGTNCQTLSSSL